MLLKKKTVCSVVLLKTCKKDISLKRDLVYFLCGEDLNRFITRTRKTESNYSQQRRRKTVVEKTI